MVDWGPDMEQLADALGVGQFAVAGHSGGGPHALAVAAHLPDRVTRGVLASPVGPFDEDGFAKLLVMKDLKLVVKLRHFHKVIRWAYGSDVKKAKEDRPVRRRDRRGRPVRRRYVRPQPAQRAMFEERSPQGSCRTRRGSTS